VAGTKIGKVADSKNCGEAWSRAFKRIIMFFKMKREKGRLELAKALLFQLLYYADVFSDAMYISSAMYGDFGPFGISMGPRDDLNGLKVNYYPTVMLICLITPLSL
jgi:hypothetical protein